MCVLGIISFSSLTTYSLHLQCTVSMRSVTLKCSINCIGIRNKMIDMTLIAYRNVLV